MLIVEVIVEKCVSMEKELIGKRKELRSIAQASLSQQGKKSREVRDRKK